MYTNEILTTIQRPVSITRKMLLGIITNWLETSDHDWLFHIGNPVLPEGIVLSDFKEGGKFTDPNDYCPSRYLIMLHPGCSTPFTVENINDDSSESIVVDVTLEKCLEAMRVLSEKSPQCFRDIIEENDDANTASAWAECLFYGDVVFC